MTDLEKKIDQDLGNDTEHARVTFLKYLNLGRQVEGEARAASGQFTQADVDAKVKQALSALYDRIHGILEATRQAQLEVERVEENDKFAAIKSTPPASVEVALAEFESILKTVDQKHGALIADRNAQLEALRALWA